MCVCAFPSVHSLPPSLLPSVPLIPECVTNGRSRCSALLCLFPGDSSSVCAYVCMYMCVCTCACFPLMGGLVALRRGLSRIPSSRREGREGERWAGGTRLLQLALGLPLGTGPPSIILPWDVRSLIASQFLFPLIFSPSLLKSIPWQLIYLHCFTDLLEMERLCELGKELRVLGVFILCIQKRICLCNGVFVF